jgi:hypothetical protein
MQLIGYLLCFYLVFKGFEIFQVALCSTKTEKGGAMTLGVLAIIAAVILAFFFAVAFSLQGSQMPPLGR